MDKTEAIEWCKLLKNLPAWPRTPHFKSVPEGWKWVISHKPYCNPEILLEHTGHDERITKDDIK